MTPRPTRWRRRSRSIRATARPLSCWRRWRSLPGKAIRLYREALLLEPGDRQALKGQGDALVAKGAIAQAKVNLAKLKTLCKGGCPEVQALAAEIAKGPPITTAQVAKKDAPKAE